jgi:DNA-binding NtrC family response regulator
LVIDDEPDMRELLTLALEKDGARVVAPSTVAEALERVEEEEFEVVITDLNMSEVGGLEVCQRIGRVRPRLPVIVVTGQSSLDTAVAAMRAGASDFITKPVDPSLLSLRVAQATERSRLHAELVRLREAAGSSEVAGIIGSSRIMKSIHQVIHRVGGTDAPVVIQGETGVGKELVARAIHEASPNGKGPFVAINCAAIPATLIESELFGHARGAFTDAKVGRTGLFVQANGGTIFLDEISELPLEMQPKLLRALQQRAVRPVGSNQEARFEARLVAASNRDLEEEVDAGRFRADLYYRINVVRIVVPPLRDREGDVLELAQHFLSQHGVRSGKPSARLSPEVAAKLMAYAWPGNVRELENCVARGVAFARFEELVVDDLPEKIKAYDEKRFVASANDEMELMSVAELERRYIQRVLTLFDGDKTRAARSLGIDRRSLEAKIGRAEGDESPGRGG